MTGRELINWIIEHQAEELQVAIQYRDGGGNYFGGEIVGMACDGAYPCLAHIRTDSAGYVDITYSGLTPNATVL